MGDIIYRPLIEDMTWSYSRLTCFDDCRYRWFMKYICNMKESPQFYASFGKFMHEIIEDFYNGILSKDDMKTVFLCGFSSRVQGTRPSEKIIDSYIKKGISYLDSFVEFPYKMVSVEEAINFDIDGIKFLAILDYVGQLEDGSYVIVDNKSRELKQRSGKGKPTKKDIELDDMLKQLYVYSAAVKKKYGEFPKKLCFNCFKNKEFIEEDFDIEKYKSTIEWVKKTVEDIKSSESGDFYPNIEFFTCRYICGLSEDCCYWKERW